MTTERIYHCDAPDCTGSIQSLDRWPGCPGLLFVFETQSSGKPVERFFCTWDCALKFAGTIPPPEIIPFTPLDEGENV